MPGLLSRCLQGKILALQKDLGQAATEAQAASSYQELDAAIRPMLKQLRHLAARSQFLFAQGRLQFRQQLVSPAEVYWPTIVRIDQAQVPQLRSLVEIGHTGRDELENQLGKGID